MSSVIGYTGLKDFLLQILINCLNTNIFGWADFALFSLLFAPQVVGRDDEPEIFIFRVLENEMFLQLPGIATVNGCTMYSSCKTSILISPCKAAYFWGANL